tara:strand:+ start:84752 stop:85711 length:960 start_codon:yes stop_codon:yes gene_type:complete
LSIKGGPVAAYTRLSEDDVAEILFLYGFEDIKEVEPLSLGISNSNYRCSLGNSDAVILKVSNDKGISEMQEEQEILEALGEFPFTLTPYKTKSNASVYTWKELYGAVFPFVSGSKSMGSLEDLEQLGEALGLLHMFSIEHDLSNKGFRCHSKVGYDLTGVLEYCELENSLEEFRVACSDLFAKDEVKLWKESNLPKGLIHGDLYIDNALFEDGKLQMLLDFEQSGIGCFLQDIGISVSGSCLSRDGVDLDMVEAFLKGYQSQRKLTDEESKLLNFSITLGLMEISLWRIKRFHEGDLDPLKRESFRELIQLAKKFKDSL